MISAIMLDSFLFMRIITIVAQTNDYKSGQFYIPEVIVYKNVAIVYF